MRRHLSAAACALVLSLWAGAAAAELVVVAARGSSIKALTPDELQAIYLGRMDRLADGSQVVPIDQSEGSGAYATFCRQYLGQSTAQVKAHWSKRIFTGRGQPPRSVADGEAMARAIAGDPSAIGYLERELVDDRLRVVRIE